MIKSAINKYYKENSTNFNKTLPYKNTIMIKLSEILSGKIDTKMKSNKKLLTPKDFKKRKSNKSKISDFSFKKMKSFKF